MAEQVDLQRLRSLIEGVCVTLYQRYGHEDLPALCERLGLPSPPPKAQATKHERLTASLKACPDERLPHVAQAVLDSEPLIAPQQMELQDVVWLGRDYVEIPGRTRRELAKELDLSDHLKYPDRFLTLLGSLWDLGEDEFNVWGPHLGTLRSDIQRHVIRFPDDWSTEDLFEQLRAFEAPHPRFGRFLEGLAASEVLPDEQAQRRFVELANRHLQPVGAQFRQEGETDGYPQFHLHKLGRGTARRPRNLIFATQGKPDIRFTSALDNDIEIAEQADKILVYDHPVGKNGLLWSDLLSWWQEARSIADTETASRTLYDRMQASLPRESAGQKNLFWLYHNLYKGQLHDVPALLPEIWVHWDPKTIRDRGERAMQNLRMDFLMLLPGNRRVVLEVDGMQHYTRDGGAIPDSARYAATMAGDRDLKFRGYEVFRFGHDELRDRERARPVLTDFFRTLLGRTPDSCP
ncbi:AbiJ-related protein [Streptomyces rochei]|uniref:AbiJ-related protein n=1 Tax=Streptomyces rochei TaxID=1928 RepID=UPI003693D1ED